MSGQSYHRTSYDAEQKIWKCTVVVRLNDRSTLQYDGGGETEQEAAFSAYQQVVWQLVHLAGLNRGLA